MEKVELEELREKTENRTQIAMLEAQAEIERLRLEAENVSTKIID